jgi:hypothetical protein
MTGIVEPRAPAIAEKLEAARAMLAVHAGEVAQTVLDAAENVPGALKRLTDLRTRISTGELAVAELEKAHELAARIDRQAHVAAATQMRAEQFAEFKKEFGAREKAMAAVLEAARDMAAAYGEYSEATLRTLSALPAGTVVPPMSIGSEGFAGPAFGPCERLILAELWRLAPDREDGIGRFVLPFAKSSTVFVRENPEAIKPGIDEFAAADQAIVADIEKQIEKLDQAAMQRALVPERKDAAA